MTPAPVSPRQLGRIPELGSYPTPQAAQVAIVLLLDRHRYLTPGQLFSGLFSEGRIGPAWSVLRLLLADLEDAGVVLRTRHGKYRLTYQPSQGWT